MLHTTNYHFENFGFSLPEACVEVQEVQATKTQQFWDDKTQTNKNTVVRIKVWADEAARIEGKQPLEQVEIFIDLDETMTNEIHNTALEALFPDAITS